MVLGHTCLHTCHFPEIPGSTSYLHICCVSAMSPRGAGMPAYTPSLPRTATCWPKHACSCISCVPAPTYCDSKSSACVISIAAESQQCHVALQTHLFMPAMPQGHHTVVWKCLCLPSSNKAATGQHEYCCLCTCPVSTLMCGIKGTPAHISAVTQHSHLAAQA